MTAPTPDEAAAPCHVETFTDSSRAWGWQCFTCDRSEAGYPGLRMAETAGDRHRVDVATRNILAERDALRRDLAAAREDLEKATRLRLQLWDRLDKARAREAAARPVLDAARGYWRDGRTGPIVAAVVAYEAALSAPVEAGEPTPTDSESSARRPHDAAATGLRPCRLRDSACADPGCTVCFTDRRAGEAGDGGCEECALLAQHAAEPAPDDDDEPYDSCVRCGGTGDGPFDEAELCQVCAGATEPAPDRERLAEVIDRALFGSEEGDLVDDDADLPVGELRRLVRDEAVPAVLRALAAARPVLDADRLARALHDADCGCGDYDEVEDPRYITAARAALSAPVEAAGANVVRIDVQVPFTARAAACNLLMNADPGKSIPELADVVLRETAPYVVAANSPQPEEAMGMVGMRGHLLGVLGRDDDPLVSTFELLEDVIGSVRPAPVEAGATEPAPRPTRGAADSRLRNWARGVSSTPPSRETVAAALASLDGIAAYWKKRADGVAAPAEPAPDLDAYDAIEVLRGRPDQASRTLAAAAQAVADWWNDPTYPYQRAEVEKAAPELAAAMWELLGGGPNSPALDVRALAEAGTPAAEPAPDGAFAEMATVIDEVIAHYHQYNELDEPWLAETARRLRALAGAGAPAEPRWKIDETRTEWAVRSTDPSGAVGVDSAPDEPMAREWARRFPIHHPAEVASAEPVWRTVVRRVSEWTTDDAPAEPTGDTERGTT